MGRKTLEEIEAVHAARAANKLGAAPELPADPPADPPADLPADLPPNPAVDESTELENLRQQYSALKGRLAPTQQQLEEYRRLYDSERTLREQEKQTLQAELDRLKEEAEAKEFNPMEYLSEEERELFDEESISVMAKVAQAAARAAAPQVDVRNEIKQVQQELAAQKVVDYRNQILNDPARGLTSLPQLAHDPEFTDWLGQEGNEEVEPLIRSLFQAQTTQDIDRMGKAVAKRLATYQGSAVHASSPSRQTDARTSLDRAAQRRPRSMSNGDIEQKLNEAKQLARSRNPADRKRAEEIINSL